MVQLIVNWPVIVCANISLADWTSRVPCLIHQIQIYLVKYILQHNSFYVINSLSIKPPAPSLVLSISSVNWHNSYEQLTNCLIDYGPKLLQPNPLLMSWGRMLYHVIFQKSWILYWFTKKMLFMSLIIYNIMNDKQPERLWMNEAVVIDPSVVAYPAPSDVRQFQFKICVMSESKVQFKIRIIINVVIKKVGLGFPVLSRESVWSQAIILISIWRKSRFSSFSLKIISILVFKNCSTLKLWHLIIGGTVE